MELSAYVCMRNMDLMALNLERMDELDCSGDRSVPGTEDEGIGFVCFM